jgi:hypothetical protein
VTEFTLNTGGEVKVGHPAAGTENVTEWGDLDAFTQGYVEALFFTSQGDDGEAFEQGFSDLAPVILLRIISDCAAFRRGEQWQQWLDHAADADIHAEDEAAGRDFWYTRNGHGCGFWDGDWPEPYATALTDAAKSFGEVDAYLGDDGKVYL